MGDPEEQRKEEHEKEAWEHVWELCNANGDEGISKDEANACIDANASPEDAAEFRKFVFNEDGNFHSTVDANQDGLVNVDELRTLVNVYMAHKQGNAQGG